MKNESMSEYTECHSEKLRRRTHGEEKKKLWLSFLLWIGVMENAIPQSPS